MLPQLNMLTQLVDAKERSPTSSEPRAPGSSAGPDGITILHKTTRHALGDAEIQPDVLPPLPPSPPQYKGSDRDAISQMPTDTPLLHRSHPTDVSDQPDSQMEGGSHLPAVTINVQEDMQDPVKVTDPLSLVGSERTVDMTL